MATKTDPDQDRYNPGARQYHDLTGGDNEPSSTDMGGFESRGVKSQDDIDQSRDGLYKPTDGIEDSKRNAGQAEKQAVGDTAVGKAAAVAASSVNATLGQAVKLLGKIKTKKGGLVAGIISLILIAIIGIGAFYSLSLAPVAFFTNVMDDLNDSVAALDDRKMKVFRTKTAFRDTDTVMKGCASKMSIRCKYRSLSAKDVAQLKKAGIELEGRKIGGRTFPSAYKIGDRDYTPRQLADAIRNDPSVNQRFRTAFDMRFFSTVSGNFRAVLAKFRTSAKAATAAGDTTEERFENLAKTGSREAIPPDAKFIPAEGEDPDNVKNWVIEGGDPNQIYTSEQKALAEQIKNFGKVGFKAGFLKSVSVTGWADTACSFKNMIGFTAQVAKIYQKRHLIQAALPIAALAFKMKAGEATPEDAEAIGEYFARSDSRKLVDDLAATVEDNSQNFNTGPTSSPSDMSIVQKENAYYGKNATDGNLAQLSLHRTPFKPTETSIKYSLSLSGNSLVSALSKTAEIMTIITSIGMGNDKDNCDIVQSWWARGIGFVAGIFAAFGSGGTTIGFNIAAMAVVAVGMYILQEKLISMVSGSPVPPDADIKPEDRQAIQWTGIAAVMDEAAMRNGLVPGTPDAILAYQQDSLPTKQKYIAMESQKLAWNDLSSPYSLLGQLVVQKDRIKPTELTIPETIASINRLFTVAREKGANPAAFASTGALDKDRLNVCDDDSYKKATHDNQPIAVDVQCNVRYHFPSEDAALEPDAVAEYMEKNGYVEVDTDDGFPKGYTPPSESDASNFVDSLISGAINEFYNTRSSVYNIDGKVNKYAIYLDYCVYRSMPWGETYEESGAFGSVEDGWINGSNCMLRDGEEGDGVNGSVVKYFRSYTVTNSAVSINDEYTPPASYTVGSGGVSADQPPDTVSFGSMGWGLKDNVDYYTSYPCEGGMADEGKYVHPTRGFSIRLCQTPGGDDVSSLVSGRISALLKKAKDQEGINLTVYSGFRSYEEQARLYRQNCSSNGVCDPATAVPGQSNHEEGLAGDFALDGASFCFPNGHTCVGNAGYDFMVEESGAYGFLKHPREAWHWGMRTYQ